MGENRGIAAPRGFLAAGVACGIKKKGKDLALIYSEEPAVAAGVFTTNLVKAAPVKLSQRYLKTYRFFQAIVANSGCANACTGEEGLKDAEEVVEETKKLLDLPAKTGILIASTGVIGTRLPVRKVKQGLTRAVSLLESRGKEAAKAIMTTDTFPKEKVVELKIGGKKCFLAGMAKGAGMIEPEMATMLAFVTTDVSVEESFLKASLREAVEESFNLISVDGEMSTNDSVFILANGLAGNEPISAGGSDANLFREALRELLKQLAKLIILDGEGATKFVKITIRGAASREVAKTLARRLSRSLLLKTALFGGDANWGRVMAALGSAGVCFNPERVDIYFSGIKVAENGKEYPFKEKLLSEKLEGKEIEIDVDLKEGRESVSFYTTDLSEEYVRINASYRS